MWDFRDTEMNLHSSRSDRRGGPRLRGGSLSSPRRSLMSLMSRPPLSHSSRRPESLQLEASSAGPLLQPPSSLWPCKTQTRMLIFLPLLWKGALVNHNMDIYRPSGCLFNILPKLVLFFQSLAWNSLDNRLKRKFKSILESLL